MKKWTGIVACAVLSSALGGYLIAPVLQGQVNKQPEIPKDLYSFRHVVKRVLPAVVSIDAEKAVVRNPKKRGDVQFRRELPPNFDPFGGFDDKQIPEEFRKFFEEFRRQPFNFKEFEIPQQPPVGFGSGFAISPDGVIVTNYHVVAGASKVTVRFPDGKKYVTTNIKGDRKTDLAIVKINTKGERLPYLEFGDSSQMEIGDRVLAIGAPFGLTGSVTHGIISAKGRNGLNMNMYEDFIQTDAAINPGNSGGPLVNLEGKVIGVNSAIKSRSGSFAGVGLAVSSNIAKHVARALVKDGVVKRGYLGVQVTALADDVAARFGLEKGTGVVVSKVFDNTPAAKAGLKAGDVLLTVNGEKINSGHELQMLVAALPVNRSAAVEIFRDGQRQTLQVTIEQQPEEFGLAQAPLTEAPRERQESTTLDKIGVAVADLTPALARQLGFDKDATGVVITDVEEGSLGFNAGLRRGMLIVKVDKQEVRDAKSAREAINQASVERGILLQVRTPQGGTNYVLLQTQTE